MVHSDPKKNAFLALLSNDLFHMWNVSFLIQMAGMMLLQISVLCTISELIIAITVLHWFVSSRKNKVPSNESE